MKDLECFELPRSEMIRITEEFHLEMRRGLTGIKSSLKMLPTYVRRPEGDERGRFIALDIGGTNLRILEVELRRKRRLKILNAVNFKLDNKYISGKGEELFLYLAESLKKFLKKWKLDKERWKIGFTFSFPLEQSAIDSGRLVRWTKGFDVRGVVGKDVVKLLRNALAGIGMDNIKICALLNDTVGTLATRSYEDKNCDISVILGTGTNACYAERISRVSRLRQIKGIEGEMIINIEWGNFNRLRLTPYDKELDKASNNRGQQILEKMVSGKYLGASALLIFEGIIGKKGDRHKLFTTEFISRIENDKTNGLDETGLILKKLGFKSSTFRERLLLRKICESVSRRASRITASCIAAIVKELDPTLSRRHTIAIDGSLYEKHPVFSKNMKSGLRELFGQKASRIRMVLTKDGSGTGAAIVAAATLKSDLYA